LYLAQPY